MAQANLARRHGDDFQARLFWLSAASLLDSHSSVVKVAYETGPKSFDDITIDYDPVSPIRDHEDMPIYRRHLQVKWHTTAGVFGYEDLTDPGFINATRYSILERAQHALRSDSANRPGTQFQFVTNWRIKPDDPLLELVRKESDALDLRRLFDGTTDGSRKGRVRRLWRDHLGVDNDGLRAVVRVLGVEEESTSLIRLRDRLNDRSGAVGMKRVSVSEAGFSYDDLVFKLLDRGRVEFDRNSFRAMAEREGLLDQADPLEQLPAIGIRSFMHPIDVLEERCTQVLNLVPYFDGRYVRNQQDWQERILPDLRGYLIDAARAYDQLRLVIDAHVSLAFATGSVLNVKSGKTIEIEQRTGGRTFWSLNDAPPETSWPTLRFQEEAVAAGRLEIAVAIGLTHDVSPAVRVAVSEKLDRVGTIVHCCPEGGPSQLSVRCGAHAWMLAEAIVKRVHALRVKSNDNALVHIFIAGPNGFTFFLGQHQRSLGPCVLYEWDFDGQRRGGYSRGLFIEA